MSRVRIKICGIREPAHAAVAAEAGADAIGLVFAERSPRRLTRAEAEAVARAAPPFVERVGLFAEHEAPAIRQIAANLGLTLIQLHGAYEAGAVESLAPLRVIRAVAFDPDTAADTLLEWDDAYERLGNLAGVLLDTPGEGDSDFGGLGEPFDWAALRAVLDRVKPSVPLILAGGLTAENVADAVRAVRPWAVDVSSGVESSRGNKDPDRIRAFCEAVRGAEVIRDVDAEVRKLTALLRTGTGDLWIRLRAVLESKALDPRTVYLAESFEDDPDSEFGILVAPDGRVYQYELRGTADSMMNAELVEWQELELTPELMECYEGLPVALRLAKGECGSSAPERQS